MREGLKVKFCHVSKFRDNVPSDLAQRNKHCLLIGTLEVCRLRLWITMVIALWNVLPYLICYIFLLWFVLHYFFFEVALLGTCVIACTVCSLIARPMGLPAKGQGHDCRQWSSTSCQHQWPTSKKPQASGWVCFTALLIVMYFLDIDGWWMVRWFVAASKRSRGWLRVNETTRQYCTILIL